MYEPPPGCEITLKTNRRQECMESRLVLESAGITSEAVHHDGWWFLIVNAADVSAASAELEAYREENPARVVRRSAPIPIYGGAAVAVYVYAGIIISMFIMTARQAFGLQWLTVGQTHAGSVMSGQWWRTVTALTLHMDTEHLIGNLVFGIVFGLLAGRILGGGVAWLAIVIAGALGNFVNAMVQPSTHMSIGASTAVFAALGVMVSHALRPRASISDKPLKRWSPLIAGLVLLAFTGVGGERTDVAAHLTGFLAGMLIGWIGCRLPDRWLASRAVQAWSGVASIAIIVVSWVVAIAES